MEDGDTSAQDETGSRSRSESLDNVEHLPRMSSPQAWWADQRSAPLSAERQVQAWLESALEDEDEEPIEQAHEDAEDSILDVAWCGPANSLTRSCDSRALGCSEDAISCEDSLNEDEDGAVGGWCRKRSSTPSTLTTVTTASPASRRSMRTSTTTGSTASPSGHSLASPKALGAVQEGACHLSASEEDNESVAT